MIKLTLEFDNAAETLDALFKIYGRDVGGTNRPVHQLPMLEAEPVTAEISQPVLPAEAPKAKRGRKSNAQKAAEAAAAAPKSVAPAPQESAHKAPAEPAKVIPSEPVATPPIPAGGPSLSDALTALEKLFSKKGMPVAEETLKKYGATKLRELDRKHYPAFVKDCHDQVNA